MAIELLKSTSTGLTETLKNVKHHAQGILPHVNIISNYLKHFHEKGTWLEGDRVHKFITKDGRQFVFRAIRDNGEYVGIRMLLIVSRGNEVPIVDVTDIQYIDSFITVMRKVLTNKKPLERGDSKDE